VCTHIPWHEHISTHDNDLFGPKESLWVFCGCQRQVGERANRSNRDSIGLVLTQKTQDLLVAWFLGRRE